MLMCLMSLLSVCREKGGILLCYFLQVSRFEFDGVKVFLLSRVAVMCCMDTVFSIMFFLECPI